MNELHENEYNSSESASDQQVNEMQQSQPEQKAAPQTAQAESTQPEQQAAPQTAQAESTQPKQQAAPQASQAESAQPEQQAAPQAYSWMQNQQRNERTYGNTGRQTYGQTGQTYGQTGQTYRQTGQTYGQNYGQTYGQTGNGYQQNQSAQQNGQQYQQTAWNSQPHYNYYQRQQAQQNVPHDTKKHTGSGKGSHWGTAVAMALVFGLIAGTVTFGVNRAANALFPAQPQIQADAEAAVPEEERNETHLSVADSEMSDTEEVGAVSSGETRTVAQVASECMPALVTISTMSVQEMRSFFGTQQFEAQGAGTGVIVGENDTELLIATNNHVIEGAQEVSIGFIDESVAEAQIKGTDPTNDLAVVAVKLEDIPDETRDQIKIVTIGDSDALVLGDQVVAIGNALGVGQSVTSGYVSALNRELDLNDGFTDFKSSGLIQTDAAINSGNSGGALLNMKGELIGINEAKSAYTSSGVTVDNVGYAIPMSKAQPILEELMNQVTREKYSEDEQGYLGVSLVNVSSEFAELYGIPQGVGFAEVAEDGPAAEAGALKGDILTEFGGKAMTSVDDVMNEVKYYRSGEEVEMTVLRADNGEYKEVNLTVTLGTKDAISTLQTQ